MPLSIRMKDLEAVEKRSFWRSNLGVMVFSSGFWRIGGRMTSPFWALYVLQLGGSAFHIGLIAAVSSILSIIPSFFGGYLADSYGRKKMIDSMSILVSLNNIIYILAPRWEWLLLAKSIDTILLSLRQPAFNALLADSTSAKNRAVSYGYWQAIPPAFGLLSPYAIGILMDRMGILPAQRWAYAIKLVTCLFGSLLRYRYMTETLSPASRARVSAVTIVKETFNDFKETTKVLPQQLWILIIMGILFILGSSTGSIFMVTFATDDVIHLTSAEWGLIITASIPVSMIMSMLFARMADRYGRLKMMLISLFLTPLILVGFIYSREFTPTFFFYISLTILAAMGNVASQALFIDFSPKEHRGRINAMTSIIGGTQNFTFTSARRGTIVSAVGNIIGGLVYGGSYSLPFFLMAGAIGLTAIIGAVFVKEPKDREE